LQIIARIRTPFPTKFGLPRQSGLAGSLPGRIFFEPAFRQSEAVWGLESYSHIWLIWQFSEALRPGWSATVRPPRLGGNTRMGVFATRSPFRPNSIGLSCVRLDRIIFEEGPVLHVSGADLMDGTPIFDIKPYLPLTDCRPEASVGFAGPAAEHRLRVIFPEALLALVPEELRPCLLEVLAQDPRPAYQNDPSRRYGFPFAGLEVRFTVDGAVLTVREVEAAE